MLHLAKVALILSIPRTIHDVMQSSREISIFETGLGFLCLNGRQFSLVQQIYSLRSKLQVDFMIQICQNNLICNGGSITDDAAHPYGSWAATMQNTIFITENMPPSTEHPQNNLLSLRAQSQKTNRADRKGNITQLFRFQKMTSQN